MLLPPQKFCFKKTDYNYIFRNCLLVLQYLNSLPLVVNCMNTIVEKERMPMRRGLSESDLLDKDVVDMLNESLNNFPSVAFPPPSVEDDWLSPQKFRDILDKKERNWKQSNQVIMNMILIWPLCYSC